MYTYFKTVYVWSLTAYCFFSWKFYFFKYIHFIVKVFYIIKKYNIFIFFFLCYFLYPKNSENRQLNKRQKDIRNIFLLTKDLTSWWRSYTYAIVKADIKCRNCTKDHSYFPCIYWHRLWKRNCLRIDFFENVNTFVGFRYDIRTQRTQYYVNAITYK